MSLRIDDVHKSFGAVRAARGVTFRAQDGTVTGLLGPNGAGTTTTLRVLSGLVRPDQGHAYVDDVDVHAEPERARARLGLLPDARGLYPRLSARENVRYFGALHGLAGRDLDARTDALLARLGLAELADRRVAGFSQGERAKVAIARALVHDPRNVVLDEPTNGLDVTSTRAMRALVRELRAEGRCVLFSSHIMQEVSALCDRVVVLAGGRVVAEGTASELRALAGTDDLEEAFLTLAGAGDPDSGAMDPAAPHERGAP